MDTPSQAAALEEEKAGVQAELEAEAVEAAATAEVEAAAQAAAGGGGGGTKDGPSYNMQIVTFLEQRPGQAFTASELNNALFETGGAAFEQGTGRSAKADRRYRQGERRLLSRRRTPLHHHSQSETKIDGLAHPGVVRPHANPRR